MLDMGMKRQLGRSRILFSEWSMTYKLNRWGSQTGGGKSDHRIVPVKSGNADGGKAMTQ